MTPNPPGRGLEEKFGPLRLVDEIVEHVAAGGLAFFHPCFAAAKIGHSRGPNLLTFQGRRERASLRSGRATGFALLPSLIHGAGRIG